MDRACSGQCGISETVWSLRSMSTTEDLLLLKILQTPEQLSYCISTYLNSGLWAVAYSAAAVLQSCASHLGSWPCDPILGTCLGEATQRKTEPTHARINSSRGCIICCSRAVLLA